MSNIYASYFDNVKVDLIQMAYDDTKRIPYMEATPLVENIPGHIQDIFNSPEGDVTSIHERDRMGRFRLTIRSTYTIDQYIKSGVFVRISQRKNPDTKAWVDSDDTTQYVIKYVAEVFHAQRWKTLTLAEDDSGNG